MALYDQETARTKEPNYHTLKTAPERYCGKRDQAPRVKKERKPALRGKLECFQWKAHGQCSKGDSCSFSHDIQASGNSGKGQRRKGRSSSPASHPKAQQTDGEGQTSHRDQAINRTTLWIREKFYAKSNSVKIRHVDSGILPCV